MWNNEQKKEEEGELPTWLLLVGFIFPPLFIQWCSHTSTMLLIEHINLLLNT